MVLFQPLIEIRDGRHPCSVKTFGGSDFIPNDTVIGYHDVRMFTIFQIFFTNSDSTANCKLITFRVVWIFTSLLRVESLFCLSRAKHSLDKLLFEFAIFLFIIYRREQIMKIVRLSFYCWLDLTWEVNPLWWDKLVSYLF